jgi:hypothetical protein
MERLKSLTLPSDNDAKDMPDSIESNALLPCLLVQVNVLSSALTFRKDNLTSHFIIPGTRVFCLLALIGGMDRYPFIRNRIGNVPTPEVVPVIRRMDLVDRKDARTRWWSW